MRPEANLLGDQRISTLAVEAASLVGRGSVIGRLRRIRSRRAHERSLARATRGVARLATCQENQGKIQEESHPQGIGRKSIHQRASAAAAMRRSLFRVTTKETPIPRK